MQNESALSLMDSNCASMILVNMARAEYFPREWVGLVTACAPVLADALGWREHYYGFSWISEMLCCPGSAV